MQYISPLRTKPPLILRREVRLLDSRPHIWILFLTFLMLLTTTQPSLAQWTDSFETPEASWWQLSQSANHQLRSAQRAFQGAKDDLGFEKLTVDQRGNKPIQVAHRIKPMLLIDELVVRLWVKSKRPGTQLGARITLPHTIDASTGRRLTVVVLGQATLDADRWTMLKLDQLSARLESQLPTLRKVHRKKIDPSGAFIDLVVLQDEAGPGENQICVDGLIIDGVAFANEQPPSVRSGPLSKKQDEVAKAGAALSSPHGVKIAAGVLEIDDSPSFVRAIQSSGESFEFLKSLGFNAIELRQSPTIVQDQQAARLGIWLIAPPAFVPQVRQKQEAFQSVIAWNLGDRVGEAELESARAYITEYRNHHLDAAPVFIAGALSHQWEWSRLVDLQVIDAGSLFSQYELANFGQRLKSIRGRGKPGVPSWAIIHTEPSTMMTAQWNSFPGANEERVGIGPDQLRLQALHAILGGARGLKFHSNRRLDGEHPTDELRAAALKWLNLQLDVIAPWAASGNSSISANTTSEVLLGAIATDRAALFVLANQSPGSQFELAPTNFKTTKISLSGQDERAPRFQLSWRGVRQLNTPISRNGATIEVERTGNVDYLIIADDETALRFAKETLERRRPEIAAAQLRLATLWLQQTQQGLQRAPAEFAPVEAKLTQAGRDLTQGNEDRALRHSEDALRLLSGVRRAEWSGMTIPLANPLISPLCVSAELASAHAELSERISQQPWSRNRMPAGEIESIESLEASGALAYQTENSDYVTEITSCDREPHRGQSAISLIASSSTAASDFEEVTAAVTFPGVPVRQGDLVRYRVWARSNPDRTATGENRIQLFDSLGTRNLGFSQATSREWMPVTFYRFAPADSDAALTVGLLGAGAVDLDSVEVQTITSAQIGGNFRVGK